MLDQLVREGLFKTRDPLAGVRKCKCAAADASLGTQTGMVCGFAPLPSNQE